MDVIDTCSFTQEFRTKQTGPASNCPVPHKTPATIVARAAIESKEVEGILDISMRDLGVVIAEISGSGYSLYLSVAHFPELKSAESGAKLKFALDDRGQVVKII